MPSLSRMSQIQAAVLGYLERHPNAADTVEGVACWWLPEGQRWDQATITQALEGLAQAGQIQCRVNGDNHTIYYNAGKSSPR